MTKTFKPVIEADRQFKVMQSTDARADFQLAIMDDFNGNKYASFDNSTAPALALAILEAAGFEDSSTGGHITGARIAVGDLKRHVKMQERATAEAEAQAKLEAEALALENARCEALQVSGFNSFDDLPAHKQMTGLAVARKAREMRAEK